MEVNQTTDGISPMKFEHVHVISDALVKFLDQNDEYKERDGITKVCESVVRLMPDILMVN